MLKYTVPTNICFPHLITRHHVYLSDERTVLGVPGDPCLEVGVALVVTLGRLLDISLPEEDCAVTRGSGDVDKFKSWLALKLFTERRRHPMKIFLFKLTYLHGLIGN